MFEVAAGIRKIRDKNESQRPSRSNDLPPGGRVPLESNSSTSFIRLPGLFCRRVLWSLPCRPAAGGLCPRPEPWIRDSLAPAHEDQPLVQAVDCAECFPTSCLALFPTPLRSSRHVETESCNAACPHSAEPPKPHRFLESSTDLCSSRAWGFSFPFRFFILGVFAAPPLPRMSRLSRYWFPLCPQMACSLPSGPLATDGRLSRNGP